MSCSRAQCRDSSSLRVLNFLGEICKYYATPSQSEVTSVRQEAAKKNVKLLVKVVLPAFTLKHYNNISELLVTA